MVNTSTDVQGHRKASGGTPSRTKAPKRSVFVDVVVQLGEPVLIKAGLAREAARQVLTASVVEVIKQPCFAKSQIYVPVIPAGTLHEALAKVQANVGDGPESPFVRLLKATTEAISRHLQANGVSNGEAMRMASGIVLNTWNRWVMGTLYIGGTHLLSMVEEDAKLWAEYIDPASDASTRPATHARLLAMAIKHGMSDRTLYLKFERHCKALGIQRRAARGITAGRNQQLWADYTSTESSSTPASSPERIKEVAAKHGLHKETVRRVLRQHRDSMPSVNVPRLEALWS